MGMFAQAFASAAEFLEAYRERCPGCVVTDLRMPGMNGLDLQEQLLHRQFDIPVIVLTAYAHRKHGASNAGRRPGRAGPAVCRG